MLKRHVVFMGVVGIITALLVSWNAHAIPFVMGIGAILLTPSIFASAKDEDTGWTVMGTGTAPYGYAALTIALASMPVDNTSLLVVVNMIAAIICVVLTSVAIYAQGALPSERIVWKDIQRVAIAIGLPVLGMFLVNYLVQTERSVMTGCLAICALTWVGWKQAPVVFVRIPNYQGRATA
jgi:hypothetical protein